MGRLDTTAAFVAVVEAGSLAAAGRFSMPTVETILDAHPGVGARVLLLDRVVNRVEEGSDIAGRLAPLSASQGLVECLPRMAPECLMNGRVWVEPIASKPYPSAAQSRSTAAT